MSEKPRTKYLLIDWKIDMLMTLDAATFTFLALPMDGPEGQPVEAVNLPPMGLNLDSIRKLHANLAEMIHLADRRGSSGSETTQ